MQSTRNQLIELLAANEKHYISGQALSEKLHISRSAVWKHMNELKKDGYSIEGVPNKGYKIIDYPEKITANTLKWGLATKWLGKTMVHKRITVSTQLIAHELARANDAHGTVVIADEQSGGKGRMDRAWHSSKHKGIWMSLILKPPIPPYLAPQLTLVAATVLADVISRLTSLRAQIKWPNDILINGKKVAGILTEMQAEQDQIQYVVMGMGINVLQDKQDFPDQLHTQATSLKIESNDKWDLKTFIHAILETFEDVYMSYMDNGFATIKRSWESYGFKIGERIVIHTLKDQWQAIFYGIAEDGALLIKNNEGQIQKLYSGEIDWFYDVE